MEFWEKEGKQESFSKADRFGMASGDDIVEWRCPICYRKRNSLREGSPCGHCSSSTLPILMGRGLAHEMQPFGDRVLRVIQTDPLLPIEEAWLLIRSEAEPRALYGNRFLEGDDYEHRR